MSLLREGGIQALANDELDLSNVGPGRVLGRSGHFVCLRDIGSSGLLGC